MNTSTSVSHDSGLLQALVDAIDIAEGSSAPHIHDAQQQEQQHAYLRLSSPLTLNLARAMSGTVTSTGNEQNSQDDTNGAERPRVPTMMVPFTFSAQGRRADHSSESDAPDAIDSDELMQILLHPDRGHSRFTQWVLPFWVPLLRRWMRQKQASARGAPSPATHASHGQWQNMERLVQHVAARLSDDILDAVHDADQSTQLSALSSSSSSSVARANDERQRAVDVMQAVLAARVRTREALSRRQRHFSTQALVLFGHLARATQSFNVVCRGATTILQLHLSRVLREVREAVEDVFVTTVSTQLDAMEYGDERCVELTSGAIAAQNNSNKNDHNANSNAGGEDGITAVLLGVSLSLRATVRSRVLQCLTDAWAALLLYAHKYGDAQLYNDEEEIQAQKAGKEGNVGVGDVEEEKKKVEQRVAVVHAALTASLNESLWVHLFGWVQTQLGSLAERARDGRGAAVDALDLNEAIRRSAQAAQGKDHASVVAAFLAEGLEDNSCEGVKGGCGCDCGSPLFTALTREALTSFLERIAAALQLHASSRLFRASEQSKLQPTFSFPFNVDVCQPRYAHWLLARQRLLQSQRATSDTTTVAPWVRAMTLLRGLLQVGVPNEEEAWAAALSGGGNPGGGGSEVSEAVTAMKGRYDDCMRRFWGRGGGGHVALRDAALGRWDSRAEKVCLALYELARLVEREEDADKPGLVQSRKRPRDAQPEESASTSSPEEVSAREAREMTLAIGHLHTDPISPLHVFWATEFFTLYHSTCFVSLRRERQRRLTQQLKELHTLLRESSSADQQRNGSAMDPISADKTAAASVATMMATDTLIPAVPEDDELWSTSSSDNDDGGSEHGATNPTQAATPHADNKVSDEPHAVSCAPSLLTFLASDVRLLVWLTHALLVLQERRVAIAAQDASVLHEDVVPLLVLLSSSSQSEETGAWLDGDTSPPHHQQQKIVPSHEHASFCLLAALNAELLTMPWSVEGVYLSLQRYYSLCERVIADAQEQIADDARLAQCTPLQQHKAVTAAAIAQLQNWLANGGAALPARVAGSAIGVLCDEVDDEYQRLDPLYHQLASGGVKGATLRAHLRRVTPVHWPAPCGLMLVVSMYRTLHGRLCRFRRDWDEQQSRIEEDGTGYEYVGRMNVFCAQDDVVTFAALLRTTHDMVFGFSRQPAWLWRLWFGYLAHLFTSLVPPATSELDTISLQPSGWCRQQEASREVDLFGERKAWDGWRAATYKRDNLSPQTSLRVALGEALADLALLPLSDPLASQHCPLAFPLESVFVSERRATEAQRAEALAVLQHTVPHQVCELLCLFLDVDLSHGGDDGHQENPSAPTTSTASGETAVRGKRAPSFLGLHGLIAFCRHFEVNTAPGSSKDAYLQMLLKRLWGLATELTKGR